jgi:hypothetical protein
MVRRAHHERGWKNYRSWFEGAILSEDVGWISAAHPPTCFVEFKLVDALRLSTLQVDARWIGLHRSADGD